MAVQSDVVLQEAAHHGVLIAAHALGLLLAVFGDELLGFSLRQCKVSRREDRIGLAAVQYSVVAARLCHTGKVAEFADR